MASWELVNIGSGIELVPVCHQVITWNAVVMTNFRLDKYKQTSMKFGFNHNNFHLWKFIWESLQNCSHIVQASIKNVQIEIVKTTSM